MSPYDLTQPCGTCYFGKVNSEQGIPRRERPESIFGKISGIFNQNKRERRSQG